MSMFPFPSQPHPSFQQNSFPQQPPQPAQPPPQPTSTSSQQERDPSRDPSHSSPHRAIGIPLNFATGQFAGKHVRAELIELQKADLGRK